MRTLLRPAFIALALLGAASAACAPSQRAGEPAVERYAMPVAEAQAGLQRLGFRPGPVDGIFGPRTRTAVLDYQRLRGLPQTGQIDRPFAERLEAELAALPASRVPARAPQTARASDPLRPDPAIGPDAALGNTIAPSPAAGTLPLEDTAPEPVVARAAPDTSYRQTGHDPSLVAATETRAEQLADVRFAEIDLDGDGDLDVIWNNTSNLYCGTAGCSFDIYLRESSGWRPVARLLAFEVDAAPGRTRGVRDLVVTGRRGSAVWQWNGRHYAPAS